MFNGVLPLESNTMNYALDPSSAARGRQRLWIALLWMLQLAFAAYYSLLPAVKLGEMPGSDKLWHLGGYLILALPIPFLWSARRKVCVAGVLLALYGVVLEFAQQYVPGRAFEAADMLANSTGVACGIALAAWLRKPLFALRWSHATDSSNPR